MTGPRILTIDIETSPHIVYTWGLFNQFIALNQIIEPTRMISFAAKWHGEKKILFYSDFHDGHDVMVEKAWELLDEADIVVHFNGRSFDIPHLNREFKLAKLGVPSPYKDIDLLLIARKTFKFASNKLQYIAEALGLSGKMQNEGFGLWVKCLNGDPKAWAQMRKYNIQDVRVEEELYDDFLPWIKSHPHFGLYADEEHGCARDGGKLIRRGYAYTSVGKFRRYQCKTCGGWSRGKERIFGVDERGVA